MRLAAFFLIVALAFASAPAQPSTERVDSAATALIKEEGLKKSKVMDLLVQLCDVYGPRLSWSPEYRRGADWAKKTLQGWGIQNVHYDNFGPVGKGWTIERFSAMVTKPVPFPVIAYPAAWSPGVKKEADLVYLETKIGDDFEKYKGKLKGKFVLISEPVNVEAHFAPQATRLADSMLLRMANADLQGGRRPRRGQLPRFTPQNMDSAIAAFRLTNPDFDSAAFVSRMREFQSGPRKLEFVQKEGAAAAITTSREDGGSMIVQGASLVRSDGGTPGGASGRRIGPYSQDAPAIIPQIVFAAEHYNRIVRMLKAGEKVTLDIELEVATTKPDSCFNIIGEIPGTDLKDEVVMIGGHFDTWHAGTGATDNNTGTAACMEAMRILQTLATKSGLKPRRTIRIGLWGAEEQGLLGSREYVAEKLASREPDQTGGFMGGGGAGELKKTNDYDRFSVYFNHDNGSGRIRGVYLQGNEAARPIFRSWFSAFGDPTAQTITILNTGGTDHQSFDGVGLPGFQFIQDPLEYGTRTHHSSMDVYERVEEEDMKQAASVIALFAYNAAMRDGLFPRKQMEGPSARR